MRTRNMGSVVWLVHAAAVVLGASPAAAQGRSGAAIITRPLTDSAAMTDAGRAILERARLALGRIRSIRITPDTVRVEVGGRTSGDAYTAVALDSAGRPVPDFIPVWSVSDNDLVRIEGPGTLFGLSAGRTYLRVLGTVPTERQATGDVRVSAQVPLVVTESLSPVERLPTDSVPRDLVLALLGLGSRNPVLRIGAVADGFPAELARGWRSIGSSSIYSNQGTSVFGAPYMSRIALDTLEARLKAAGWTVPLPDTPPDRGFTPAFSPLGRSNVQCRGSDHIWYNATSRRPNEAQVVIVITRNSATGECTPASRSRPPRQNVIPVVLLRTPPDVTVQTSVNAAADNGWRSEAITQGNTSVSGLSKHLAQQLSALGWTPVESTLSATGETRSYTLIESNRTWQGTLTVSGTAPGLPTTLSMVIRPVP